MKSQNGVAISSHDVNEMPSPATVRNVVMSLHCGRSSRSIRRHARIATILAINEGSTALLSDALDATCRRSERP